MMVETIDVSKVKDISSELLLPNGKLKLLSYKDYDKYSFYEIRVFCHKYGRYGLPTIELVDYIRTLIGKRSAIEIGSGHGDLGYHLGIPMTDSKIQATPNVKAFYEAAGQPIIQYPEDVEKIDALDAVRKYQPQVVVGSWLTAYSPVSTSYGSATHAIKEEEILNLVETYIMVGNLDSHGDKPILENSDSEIISKQFIVSRAQKPENDRIFVFKGKKQIIMEGGYINPRAFLGELGV